MNVVVVESPAKAKTINKYLGKDYEVLASYGHVRDLPAKDGSVDPAADFAMKWEVDPSRASASTEIAKAVKDAEKLILATDPDREGEAISWHVLEVLRGKKVLEGQAGRARRLQRHDQGGGARGDEASARRSTRRWSTPISPAARSTTSSASRCRRCFGASSRAQARPAACSRWRCAWSATARPKSRTSCRANTGRSTPTSTPRRRALPPPGSSALDGKRIDQLDLGTSDEAAAFKPRIERRAFSVASVEAKPAQAQPVRALHHLDLAAGGIAQARLRAGRTMQIAQRLYEGVDIGGETVGLITYMRTDGVDIAPEAIAGAREFIGSELRQELSAGRAARNTPPRPRTPRKRMRRSARPTSCRLPKRCRTAARARPAELYELIWKRTLASQMESAVLERTTVDIEARAGARTVDLRATGQVMRFDGFLELYQEGRDDDEDDEDGGRLPPMSRGDALKREQIDATQHFTEPPPRFTEATLVKRMEELGIGRPSTYASTLAVLRDRDYVRLDKKRLIPRTKAGLSWPFSRASSRVT